MLTSVATFSLLVSLASAAAVAKSQKLLIQDASVPVLDHINMTSFKKFAIDDMSEAKFRLHHHAVKALIGDESYLLLRQTELQARENEVWEWIWDHDLDCGDWMNEDEDEIESHYPERIYLSGRRIFDIDPKRVPQDVIDGLFAIDRRKGEIRSQMYRESYCSLKETADASDAKTYGVGKDKDEPKWKIDVPEEYLQYQIPDSILEIEEETRDLKWKAEEEKRKQDILTGKVSVRNMKMPDLTKCKKLEEDVY
ncbi:hypothetical protein KCU81_g7146, partial [Aureobasidium melanogenum]|uniref:Uncharacterized protein n=1 Tax=Aureobasidium melanogenum (strain CBS 110374) TaxID=1043003 RepID=A0A074W7P7_AURM1